MDGEREQLHLLIMRLTSVDSLHDKLRAVLETVLAWEGADAGAILLREQAFAPLCVGLDSVDGLFERETLLVGDNVIVTDHDASSAIAQRGFSAMHALPIPAGSGSTVGALVVLFRAPRPPSAQLRLADMCARYAGNAIEADAAHREQRAAREAAEQANRAKDEFLAMLGHELRNPLAPMTTALQLLRLRGMKSRELDVMERQMAHIGRLVDDLLDIARITQGKVELHREMVELAELVQRAAEMVAPLLEQRRHVLEIEVPATGLRMNVDPDRMAQVVFNLLGNAAKYSDVGSRITVRASRSDGRVRLSVCDRGVGIAPEMRARVFELFVQQRQTLDRARGGLGLGLAIVRSLVELHGGSVSVESEGLGQGSEFTVELPIIEAVTTPDPDPLFRQTDPCSLRILVVDDKGDAADTSRVI